MWSHAYESVRGFFSHWFEKPLEGRIGSEKHVNLGSITTCHARKLLPMTFLNCHAFGEVVFGGKSPEEIFMLREHAHHTGKENNCSSEDFWGWERRGIIDIESLSLAFLKNKTSSPTEKLFLAFLEKPTLSPATLDGRCRRSLPPLEFIITVTRDRRRCRYHHL